MTAETHVLQKRRFLSLAMIGKAVDEVKRIDERLTFLLEGRRPGAGAA